MHCSSRGRATSCTQCQHYEVKLRFLQQLVVDKDIEFVYCPTDVQLADFFTKPLDSDLFRKFRNSIMVQP